MSGRRVISVADLTVAIDEHEAIGFSSHHDLAGR